MKSLSAGLVLLAFLVLPRLGDAADTPNLRIAVEMVSMPVPQALALLPNLRDPASVPHACSEIARLIASGEAELTAWPEVTTKPGQRAVNEDIQEQRYVSEFYGPTTPDKERPEGAPAPPAPPAPPAGTAPVPKSFETRNVGASLEVEPTLGSGNNVIELNLVAQRVVLLDMSAVAAGHDLHGHEWKIEQPRFQTFKTTTSLSVRSGQTTLLGEFRGAAGSDRLELFLLTAFIEGGAPAPAPTR